MARITLDPLTRIEGHVRLNATVHNGRVTHATSAARVWPGFAMLLKGRDPLEAWSYAQRFCGVCTTVHAVTSIRSVEQALNLEVPPNARYYRNCLMAQHSLHEHILHFYGRSLLDWVDIFSACRANPESASRMAQNESDRPGHGTEELKAVQEKLKQLSAKGTSGFFSAEYSGHPDMRLSPEMNLVLSAHYLTAFEYLRKAARVLELLQGKTPQGSSLQHLLVGGITPAALAPERLAGVRLLIEDIRRFVHDVFLPDMIAIAVNYPEWFRYGAGITNYLAVPEFPEDSHGSRFALEGGTFLDKDQTPFRQITMHSDPYLLRNFIAQHCPADNAETSKALFQPAQLFDGKPVQSGPLAQVLAACFSGNVRVKPLVDDICSRIGIALSDFHSTMGRTLARAIRARVLADLSLDYLDRIMENGAGGDSSSAVNVEIPAGEFHGAGFHEASRGTLFHGIVIKDRKIEQYDVIAPSSWNSASRDVIGAYGPYEASLVDHPVAVAEKPLELLRTMRSFDPCIACAVHVSDPSGNEISRANVL